MVARVHELNLTNKHAKGIPPMAHGDLLRKQSNRITMHTSPIGRSVYGRPEYVICNAASCEMEMGAGIRIISLVHRASWSPMLNPAAHVIFICSILDMTYLITNVPGSGVAFIHCFSELRI